MMSLSASASTSFSEASNSKIFQVIEHGLARFFSNLKKEWIYGDLIEPFYFDVCEYIGRKGKRIRPFLFIQTYHAMGGERSLEDNSLIDSAVSFELLHSFILIHDDLIDQSEKRRGLPTFHKIIESKFNSLEGRERVGQNIALVIGNMLFTLAVRMLHETDFEPNIRQRALSRFLNYVNDTGSGEIYDILSGTRDIARTSREDILKTYHLKTTRYTFEAPCVLGALFANASETAIECLTQMAEHLGLAFQIQNDLAEFAHFKPDDYLLQTDLLEGKKTLLLRTAYDQLNDTNRSFLQMCLNSGKRTESTILKIRDLIHQSGAADTLHQLSKKLFETAYHQLQKDCFQDEERRKLLMMIENVDIFLRPAGSKPSPISTVKLAL